MGSRGRFVLAAIVAVVVAIAANRIGAAWIGNADFEDNAFHDGFAALLTQAIPALLGGAVAGAIARESGLYAALAAFALAAVAQIILGAAHTSLWHVPLVAPQSAHSRGLHYMLHNPIVPVAFGTLGGWLAGQFATGKFTLADREPVRPESDE
jgi:hypothetical protein